MAGNALSVPNTVDYTLVEFSLIEAMHPISLHQSDPPPEPKSRLERQKFKIRLASNQERRHSAVFLVEKMYSWRGYDTSGIAAKPAEGATRIALVVYGQDNQTIGTLTAGFDGPSGLLADELYRQELDALRAQGRRLVEFTKLAIDRRGGGSNRIVAALTNLAYLYGKISGYNAAVIEVNPRHVAFYESTLGFTRAGPQRICPRVNAPAILLVLDWRTVTEGIRRFGGRRDDAGAGRSLYRYFFDEQDEPGVISRLSGGR